MTLPTIDQARSWRGLTLVATDDQPVGRIEAIYVDRTTRQPEWALVHTGLFGSARTFVPLADAADGFLVYALEEGDPALFWITQPAAIRTTRTVDGLNFGEVDVEGVALPADARLARGPAVRDGRPWESGQRARLGSVARATIWSMVSVGVGRVPLVRAREPDITMTAVPSARATSTRYSWSSRSITTWSPAAVVASVHSSSPSSTSPYSAQSA